MKLYSRYEPTTDESFLRDHPKTARYDVVLYNDSQCTNFFARIPWCHASAWKDRYRNVTRATFNCMKYEIEFIGCRFDKYTSVQGVNGHIVVECGPSGWCDNPIQYKDGSIAYDFPERVSAKLKSYVAKLYSSSAFVPWDNPSRLAHK